MRHESRPVSEAEQGDSWLSFPDVCQLGGQELPVFVQHSDHRQPLILELLGERHGCVEPVQGDVAASCTPASSARGTAPSPSFRPAAHPTVTAPRRPGGPSRATPSTDSGGWRLPPSGRGVRTSLAY